jgi:pimeloyl-ACP methyl ester carboxylesterase
VFALGLSLGGYVAPRIGRAAPDLAGLIVLAGTTRPLQVVLPEQLRFLAQRDGSIDAAEQRGIDTVIAQIAALDDALARGAGALAEGAQPLLGIPLSYWRDLSAYDPVALAAELPQPLLILQGERDYQVTVAGDLARWQERFANDARATIRVYPGLNHLFIAGEGAPNPEEYFKPGRVDAQVIADIAHWIAAH